MDVTEAKEILKAIRQRTAQMYWSGHFYQRAEELSIDTQDAHRVLRLGVLVSGPKFNLDFDNWEVIVQGRILDGRTINLVLGLQHVGDNTVVTVYAVR